MKKFLTVLQFELMNYLKNKSFVITSILIAVVAGAVMFIPHFIDLSGLVGTKADSEQTEEVSRDTDMVLYDKSGVFQDVTLLEEAFPEVNWSLVTSEEEVKNQVSEEKVKAGFVVKSLDEYDYYVYNKNLSDSNHAAFDQVMSAVNQMIYCQQNGLDYAQIVQEFSKDIVSHEEVLGKDMQNNFAYCYGLVIIIFMVIIFYGVMIATSITQEKSNRSIEVLVTSTNPNCLFFGKVFAGAIASLIQVGIILGSAIGSYKINQAAWGHKLDMVFDIPAEVLLTFAFFGIGGFLFYAFLYGAVGALVSKTEDINKSAGSLQMIIMIVYFAVLTQLYNVDGIIMKVASFLPISSYSAMFTRIAMGKVAAWEVVVSFILLVISTAAVGLIGSKIYRMGTLRYGNPIKFRNALKAIKHN